MEPKFETSSDYLERTVYPSLLTAVNKVVSTAQSDLSSKRYSRRLVSGLDLLAEYLLKSKNEKETEDIFLNPTFAEILSDHPRPVFPKNLIMSREEAAIIIQAHIRGFLVRTEPEVADLRNFWKRMRNRSCKQMRYRSVWKKKS